MHGEVAGATEVLELKRKIRELERLPGKKTMEAEILMQALELARPKYCGDRTPPDPNC